MEFIKQIVDAKPIVIGLAGLLAGFTVGMLGGMTGGIWVGTYAASKEKDIEDQEAADRGDV